MKLKKYIIFDNDTGLIFPLEKSHADVAMTVPHKPISAGFIFEKICYGESITLRLKSHLKDSKFFEDAKKKWKELK